MLSRRELSSRLGSSLVVFSVTYDPSERDRDIASLFPILSPREESVFRSVLDPDRAQQFLWGRALVAYVVRGVLGLHGGRLGIPAGGRPNLESVGSRGCPDLNLSHCPGRAVLAVSAMGNVGVDVEPHSSAAPAVARRFFSAPEVAWLEGLERTARDAAFSRLWTIKEACAKTNRRGLTLPLEVVQVPPRRSGTWARGRWWNVDVADEVSCSVALSNPSLSADLALPVVELDRPKVRARLETC